MRHNNTVAGNTANALPGGFAYDTPTDRSVVGRGKRNKPNRSPRFRKSVDKKKE